VTLGPAQPLMHQVMRIASANLRPLHACLELTYRCNLHCRHCYIDPCLRQSPSHELTAGEWGGVLDQLRDAGTLSLLLTGGEIFTRPDFLDIAFEAKRRKFLLWLVTNGTMISSADAFRLKALRPYWTGISLYGASADTHEAITGCVGSFEATVGAIKLLKEQGLRVMIQAMLMDENVRDASAILDLAASMDVAVHMSHELVPTKGCALGPLQYEAAFEGLEACVSPERLLEGFPADGPSMCRAGRGVCAISPTGEVSPCLLMPLRVGSVRESTFEELWRTHPSDELEDLRSIDEQDFSECRGCEIAAYCNRCPGVALGEAGSLTGRPLSACRHAAVRFRLHEGQRKALYA
jgi:radical SAM protein with 4Fe4S-binding SPASM domain